VTTVSIQHRWAKKPLGKVADVVSGYAFKSSEFGDQGIPVIKIKNIRVGSVDLFNVDRVYEKYLTIPDRYHVRPGDVLISLTGSHISQPNSVVGRVAMHSPALPHCLLNQRVGKVIVRDVSTCELSFLFYALIEPETMRAIAMKAHGAANQANVSPAQIESIEIPIPPLSVQRRIAGILSAYDELMENSQRRIRILEDMARVIYREWFVHFRFPGHEKLPRIASPLGDIPQGWEMKKLGELISYNRQATKPGPHLDERKYVPIDCLPSKSLALLEAKPIEEAQSSLQLFEKGNILFGAMRPYFHKVVIAPFAGVTRTTCFVFKTAKPEWNAFATMTAFEEATVAYANAHSQGATIPYAVWDGSLAEMPLVLPPDALLRRFEKIAAPMLSRISQSFFTLNNLRRTRDLLLPRLLSGQVSLS
jgi:type I restriction enzyme S subunit